MPSEDQPDYLKDAAKAAKKFTANGDQKGYEDVMGAFDRHTEIEQAQKDMKSE